LRELTVVTENRVGALADVCEAMGRIGANITSISAHGYLDRGIIRLVTSDEKSARGALERIGMKVLEGELMTVKVPDKPGELGKLTRKLANSGVNVEGIYLFGKSDGHLEMAIRPDDIQKASEALRKQ
jgi:hypothetical protein